MPGNSSMRMLDLRLAESALKGEGRSRAAGRISGQMKREEFRKDKINRQIEKEQRLLKDRMTFQERKFLSIQMFKKDLNPFMVVLRNKDKEGNAEEYTPESSESVVMGIDADRLQDHGSSPHSDRREGKRRINLPSIKQPLEIVMESRYECNSIKTPSKTTGSNLIPFEEIRVASASKRQKKPGVLKVPKSLTYGNIYDARNIEQKKQKLEQEEVLPLKRLKTVTFLDQPSYSTPRYAFPEVRAQPKVTLPRKSPLSSPTDSLTPGSPPRTFSRTRSVPPAMRTYSDVLIDTCRALGPGEARMAERKRVEAEDAEGITERKHKMLQKCREEAEQDVFKDLRWKLLISVLPNPRVH